MIDLTIPAAPDEALIKFLESAPFCRYRQHWLFGNGVRASFTCGGNRCLLCTLGFDTRYIDLYHVLDLTGEGPFVKVWNVAPSAVRRFDEESSPPINDPDLYFAVQRVDHLNGTGISIEPVWANDDMLNSLTTVPMGGFHFTLQSMGVEPLTEDELARALAMARNQSAMLIN